jgi:hypothetical protein
VADDAADADLDDLVSQMTSSVSMLPTIGRIGPDPTFGRLGSVSGSGCAEVHLTPARMRGATVSTGGGHGRSLSSTGLADQRRCAVWQSLGGCWQFVRCLGSRWQLLGSLSSTGPTRRRLRFLGSFSVSFRVSFCVSFSVSVPVSVSVSVLPWRYHPSRTPLSSARTPVNTGHSVAPSRSSASPETETETDQTHRPPPQRRASAFLGESSRLGAQVRVRVRAHGRALAGVC